MLISSLIAAIALFHHGTPHHLLYVHILLQSLFFIPVSLSGIWFGKKGGLIAAVAITAVYIHHAVTVMMPTSEMAVGNTTQIVLLFLVGFLTGTYADVKRSYHQTMHGLKSSTVTTFPAEQSLLVYVDDSSATDKAVRYVANLFGRIPDVKVTLLNVLSETNPDFFGSHEDFKKEQAQSSEASRRTMEKARELLLESGFTDANISVRFAHSHDARISDVILHEQKSGKYSAIVIGGHRLSRAEEFLFGNVAIRLARQATCPVWIVDENAAAKAPASAPTKQLTTNQVQ